MSIFTRFLSGFVTILPATGLLLILISMAKENEHYWLGYFIVSGVFLAVSFALGFLVPALAPNHWKRHPSLWFFGQGLLAWLGTVLALGLINLTPLCIGKDNGDGSNNLMNCMEQTFMMSIACAPLEFILLCLTALPGGWLVKRLTKREGT
jgi:hypothetical protein